MRFGIVVFPGTNCDADTLWVVREVLQHPAEPVWHEDTDLRRFDVIVLPGGFAHGDYLRAGAIARFSPVMRAVASTSRLIESRIAGCDDGYSVTARAAALQARAKSVSFDVCS